MDALPNHYLNIIVKHASQVTDMFIDKSLYHHFHITKEFPKYIKMLLSEIEEIY